MKNENITLSGRWNLTVVPDCEVKKWSFQPVSADSLRQTGYLPIEAKVPGNFELDLLSAGLISDPFFGLNILEMQKYEDRHLFYDRVFDAFATDNSDTFIRFEGIDTVADIYLNEKLLGHTENMLIPYEFSAPFLKETGNEILVHIFPSVIEGAKYPPAAVNHATPPYRYDTLPLRKAAFMSGWDIMPRLVSGGLWKDVLIVRKPKKRFREVFLYTYKVSLDEKKAGLRLFFGVDSAGDSPRNLTVNVRGICHESSFEASSKVFCCSGSIIFLAENCRYWWPRNIGEPDLYDVSVTLTEDGSVLDEVKFSFGIRTVALERSSVTDGVSGKFGFAVNGKPVFVLGTNWVPLDAFPSRIRERLPAALELLYDTDCNTVRCWGDGIYEDDAFFDFCDRRGILVWQDFAMACAIYPDDDRYCKLISDEAESVVKRLRNHACLLIWSGDNECDLVYSWGKINIDPNTNILTRKIIPEVLHRHDFTRPYLPSSPYIDTEAYRTGGHLPEDHLWGPRDWFKGNYYKKSLCHFASETGYHGCPSPSSIKKFISGEHLWPPLGADGWPDDEWHIHGAPSDIGRDSPTAYRTGLMISQVRKLFGCVPDNIEEFALLSQISQAEALKYFIERFRIAKANKTGIIWWNLIDGWPQVSDAVVDYYFSKKLASQYIKRSQNPVCLMFWEPDSEGVMNLFGVNDLPHDVNLTYNVHNVTGSADILSGTALLPAGTSVIIGKYCPVQGAKEFLLISWEGDNTGLNHFMTGMPGIDAQKYIEALRLSGVY